MTFLDIGFTDILDIFLVAFLFYQVYMLIKGTTAMKIFTGIAALYLVWLLVRALNMQLISTILGHVMGVGVIAILIVFQQEIRKFFLFISTRYLSRFDLKLTNLDRIFKNTGEKPKFEEIAEACQGFADTRTGALILLKQDADLYSIRNSGLQLDAILSQSLLETIFKKNSPMHDGAIIVNNNIVEASKCILPLSDKKNLPDSFGLRHRAAMGVSEQSDALVIVVSEESGHITLFQKGRFRNIKDKEDLLRNIESKFNKKY